MTAQVLENTQFSTRDAHWMKLGKLITEPVTAKEAASLAGLDFTVSARQACFRATDGEIHTVPNRVAIVRDDTDEAFEFVSERYEILNYGEAFDFMDVMVEQGAAKYVAAGALQGGRQGFMVIQPDRTLDIKGDRTDLYVVLRTSHDRSRAVEVSVMPLRHKCMNQLTLRSFASGVQNRWSISHSSSMRDKLVQAQHSIAQLDEYTTAFNALALNLMKKEPTEKQARDILDHAIQNGGKKKSDVVDQVIDLWQNDTEHVAYNGSGWGLVNAVSEYLDWQQPSKGGSEHRFIRSLQGYTYKALNTTVSMVLAS